MKNLFVTIFVTALLISNPEIALAQFENSNSAEAGVNPAGGARVILEEEAINLIPEVVAEEKSSRVVLYFLAAVFLIIVAVVAMLSLRHTSSSPQSRTKFSNISDDHPKL